MSFSLNNKIDSKIVIENAHESASIDSVNDPNGTVHRDVEKKLTSLGQVEANIGRNNSGPQSFVNLSSSPVANTTSFPPSERRQNQPNLKVSPRGSPRIDQQSIMKAHQSSPRRTE
jgi:hypothetical protein